MMRFPPKRKKKPSLFNAIKRIGQLEAVIPLLVAEHESPALGFARTVGALLGIGAWLAVMAILLLR